MFGGTGNVGGWIGKIHKILRNKDKPTTIKFKDGNQYFKFDQVSQKFKPVS